jgi:hypothetical protein
MNGTPEQLHFQLIMKHNESFINNLSPEQFHIWLQEYYALDGLFECIGPSNIIKE